MAKNLNSYIARRTVVLTVIALIGVFIGVFGYFFILEQYFPAHANDEDWQLSDFIVFATYLLIGVAAAFFVGVRIAQRIVKPLKSVAAAARAVAQGDFSARAQSVGISFGEANSLIADFNAMAERLEKAEAELKYMNSSIAHELRTPLTILRGRLQGLLDGAYAPEPQIFSRLITHVEDLSTIVEDLRTLALTNADKLTLELDVIDLASEADWVLATLEHELAQAGLTIVRDLAAVEVVADRARIRQALLAMLDNCRRYAPGSTVTLQTGTRAEHVFILCADSGPGLPAEQKEHAFERFWRADASRTRARGGSGLGLPVVRGIARAHGGEALIVDAAGPGLAVELRLPRQNPLPAARTTGA